MSLGAGRFNAAVATMALMDMADIEPLFSALRELLVPGGRFVFTVCHPAFHSTLAYRFMEARETDGRYAPECGVKVTGYLTPTAQKGEGIVGQPEPQYFSTARSARCWTPGSARASCWMRWRSPPWRPGPPAAGYAGSDARYSAGAGRADGAAITAAVSRAPTRARARARRGLF